MSTPQPMVASSSAILLDGVAAALSDRAGLTPEQKHARVAEVWAVVDAFRPADPIQVMLVGQAVLFNDVIADGARDVLGGMTDSMKLRAQSNLSAMHRSLHQNLTTFLRLRDKAEAVAEAARDTAGSPRTGLLAATAPRRAPAASAAPPAPPASPAAGGSTEPPPPAPPAPARAPAASAAPPAPPIAVANAEPPPAAPPAPLCPPAASDVSPAPSVAVPNAQPPVVPPEPHGPIETQGGAIVLPPPTWRPAEPDSWIDEPYTTWVIESPAATLVREAKEPRAPAASTEPPRPDEADPPDPTMADAAPGPWHRSAGLHAVAPAA